MYSSCLRLLLLYSLSTLFTLYKFITYSLRILLQHVVSECRSQTTEAQITTLTFFFFFFGFLGPNSRHMEVPRLGVKSELLLPAYATVTATAMPCLRPTPQLMDNAGSLTHQARPGVEPTTSWFLVRFVSTAPRRKFHHDSNF